MKVLIRHLVVAHRICDSIVTDPDGHTHRVGHHPADGWRCYTHDRTSCPAVAAARDTVPNLEGDPA